MVIHKLYNYCHLKRKIMKNLKVFFLFVILSTVPSYSVFAQWNQIPSSPTGFVYDIVESDGVLYVSHSVDGMYKSTDSTITWEQINQGLNSALAKKVYQILAEGDTIYIATTDGIYKSIDAGNNWIKKSNGILIGSGSIFEGTISIFRHNGILFTGAFNGIYRSEDDGENWDTTNVIEINGLGLGPRYFTNHNGTLFAARESINIPYGYKSTDEGETWEDLTSISWPIITFLSEPPDLWAGTVHGVWLSVDNGMNWEFRGEGLPPDPYNSSIVRVNGDLVSSIIGAGSAVYRSGDEGLNWVDFGGGLPSLGSIEKLITYGDRIIATTQEGLWERDIITGIEHNNKNPKQAFTLYQNHPNPFNQTTIIKFKLLESEIVKIEILNLLGQKIETIIDKQMPEGTHEVEFCVNNLPCGIYYYRISAAKHHQIKKMMVIK